MSVVYPGIYFSSTNKSDHHGTSEILLKLALNTINQTNKKNTTRSMDGR